MAESMLSSSPLEYSKLVLLTQRPSFKPTTTSTGRKLAPARRCTKKNGCKKRWFTADEKTLLQHLVLDNESVILSRKNDGVSVHLKKEVWLSIADQFNEHPQTVTQRNSVELRRCWENMKFKAKKTLNRVRQQLVAAGATGSSPLSCLGTEALNLLANSRQAFKKPYDVSPHESETEMFQGPNLDGLSATIALQDNSHFHATFERHAQGSDEETTSCTSKNSQIHLIEQRKGLDYCHLNLNNSLEYLSSCPSPHSNSQNILSNSLPVHQINPLATVSSGGFIEDEVTNLEESSHSEPRIDAFLHTTTSTEGNMTPTSSSTSCITQTNSDNVNSHSLDSSIPLFYSISKCSVLPKSTNICIQGSFPLSSTSVSHNPLFPFASVASSAPIPSVLPLANVCQDNNTSHCETHKSNESTIFSGASCQTNAGLEQSNNTPSPMLCDQTKTVTSDDERDSAPLYARNGCLSAAIAEQQQQSLICPETLLEMLSRPVLQTPRLLELLRPDLPGSISAVADVLGSRHNKNFHQWIDNNSASGVFSNRDDLPTDLSFGSRLGNSACLANEVTRSAETDIQENDDRTCSPHAAYLGNDGVAGLDLSNKRNNYQQQQKGGQDVGGTINKHLGHNAPSKETHMTNDDNQPMFSPSIFLMPSSFDMKPFAPDLCVPSYGFSPQLSQLLPNIFSVTNSVSTSFSSQLSNMLENPDSNIYLNNTLAGKETIPNNVSSVNSSNHEHLPEVTPLISTPPSGPDPSAEAASSNAATANTAPTADIDALMAQLLNANGRDGAVDSDAIASLTDPSNLDTVVAEALSLCNTEATVTTNSSGCDASLVATLRSENALLQQRLGLMEEQRQQATVEHQQRMQLLQQEHQERLSLIAQELAIKRMLCQLHIEYALNNSTK